MKKILAIMALMAAPVMAMAADGPTFPGGEEAMQKYVAENTKYPDISKEMGIEGIVVVDFIVATDGSLKNLKVEKPIDPDLEKEAIRVVGSMPAWIPAEKNGSAVESPAKVDVPFLLD